MAFTEPQPRPRSLPALTHLRRTIVQPDVTAGLARLAIVTVIIATLWVALDQFTPPGALPAGARADAFSAERAMTQLQAIAQAPRPAGSEANAAIERQLVERLTAMGLSPEVETTTGVSTTDSGDVWAGTAHNIVARIPGTSSTRAVLLAAHYDSVPTGPGAGDCGSCVATVLETVRALQTGAPLRNDVIVLFADAEEHDMLGAKAFMAEHPWAKEVGVALNFEAIGTNGASMMNYVGPDSGRLTQPVLDALPHPLVSSFMTRLGLGNDTVQYVSQGAAGYEFVIFGGVQAYHSRLDSVSRMDIRSLQDNGSTLLSLTRTLGGMDLTASQPGDRIFFNIARGRVVQYPTGWALPLALLPLTLLASALVLGLRRRRLTLGGAALGSTIFLGSVVLSAVLVTLAEWGLRRINPNFQVFMGGSGYHDGLRLLSYISLVVLLMLAVNAWTRRWVSPMNQAVGAMLWWALLSVVTSILFPPVSYLFTFPLLGAVLALWLVVLTRTEIGRPLLWPSMLAAVIALVPAILLLAPVPVWSHAVVSYVELPTQLPLAALSILFVALGLGLVLPFLPLPEQRWRWAVPAVAGVVTVGFGIAAFALSGFSASQPLPDYVAYVLDADSRQAQWVSVGTRTDEWTNQFFTSGSRRTEYAPLPSELPDTKFAALEAPAPVVDLATPALTLVNSETSGANRTLALHYVSPRHAPNAQLVIESTSPITGFSINGKSADLGSAAAAKTKLTVQYYAIPESGFDLLVVTGGDAPVRIAVEERSNGLPEVPGMTIKPRPASTMPAPFENADPMIVRKTFAF